jgi:L-iditol 2-dehydrogenase
MLQKKLGADYVFLPSDPNIVQLITEAASVTQTFECSGAEPAITLAIRCTAQGGKLVSIGRSAKPLQNIPFFEAADKEIDMIGSFRYCNAYPMALELVASGRINIKPLVTHHFDVQNCQEAFEVSEVGRDGAIKVAIHLMK